MNIKLFYKQNYKTFSIVVSLCDQFLDKTINIHNDYRPQSLKLQLHLVLV